MINKFLGRFDEHGYVIDRLDLEDEHEAEIAFQVLDFLYEDPEFRLKYETRIESGNDLYE